MTGTGNTTAGSGFVFRESNPPRGALSIYNSGQDPPAKHTTGGAQGSKFLVRAAAWLNFFFPSSFGAAAWRSQFVFQHHTL